MSSDLLDPFDKQKPPQDKEERLYIICPHCGTDIPRITYPEIVHGDFDCPNCGAHRHSFDMIYNKGRPGYFIQKGNVTENYVTQAEWDEYQRRMAMLGERIIVTIIKDSPQLPGEKPALSEDNPDGI